MKKTTTKTTAIVSVNAAIKPAKKATTAIAVVENATKTEKAILNNAELYALINKCGCVAMSNAKSVNCVYNQFGTHSRVLQYNSKRANYRYQLLLTEEDAKLFSQWYKTLAEGEQAKYDSVPSTLSMSELPRVKSYKCMDIEALKKFISAVIAPQAVCKLPTM